jgi:hypothetical protein
MTSPHVKMEEGTLTKKKKKNNNNNRIANKKYFIAFLLMKIVTKIYVGNLQ